VAGVEIGDFFGYVVEGKHPPEEMPYPRSLEDDLEKQCNDIKDQILILQALPTPHEQDVLEKIEELELEEKILTNSYNSLSKY